MSGSSKLSNWLDDGTSLATKNASRSINLNKGADIASATTTDIGAATGNFVDITGTTTITGLGTVQTGTTRTCQFDGILTLTHNASSLILPTGANITTAAGDVAFFTSLGAGNWIATGYTRADGTALAGAGGGGNKSLFLQATAGGLTGTGVAAGVVGDFSAVSMTDGNDGQAVNVNWTTPSDFTSITKITAHWLVFSAGNAFLLFRSRNMGDDVIFSAAPSDTIALATYAGAADGSKRQTDVTAMINGLTLVIDDVVSFRFQRDGANASDTLSNTLFVLGFQIEYA